MRGLVELELVPLKRMLGLGEPDSDDEEEEDDDEIDRLLALASDILLLVDLVAELFPLSVESRIEPLWLTIDCCS